VEWDIWKKYKGWKWR